MKKYLLLGLTLISSIANSQNLPDNPEDYYNFWVGHWEVSWEEANGQTGKGTNTVEKTLDGKVIQEHFKILEGEMKGFKGTSISVYQPQLGRWKQAWADNNGGYFDFEGDVEGEKIIFKTAVSQKDGKEMISRMVFYNIQENSLTWDWESSIDGGQTWKLNWRIFYKRLIPKEFTP